MLRTMPAPRLAVLVEDFDRSPAYAGLAEALRALITDGRIPVETRLPSERDLTEAIGVSRTTVTRAYSSLRELGYLVSRVGSGSVTAVPPGRARPGDHLLPPGDPAQDKLNLTCAAPLPGPGLLSAYQRAVAALPTHLAGTGYYPSGMPDLREAVAQRYAARGVPTSPEQILIVPGAQTGVVIAISAMLRPGDRVVVESPTYPNAIAALKNARVRLVGGDVTDPELADEQVRAAVRQARPRAAYLIPDFHNPTAHLVGEREREALADELRRAGTVPIIDESLIDLALDDQTMPPPLAAYLPDSVSIGSLSKAYWGGLRIGWMRVPRSLAEQFFKARVGVDLGTAVVEQLVAADLLDTGAELLQHRIAQLRESREAALSALQEHLPEWRAPRPGGGLSIWCELPDASSTALVAAADRHGLMLVPGPTFAPEGGLGRFVRVPYSQPAPALSDAIARLGIAWREPESTEAPTRVRNPLVA